MNDTQWSESSIPSWDTVRLAVLTNRMQGIVRKMTNTLFRTARSGVINTARDFSCAIVTRDDELLVVAESLPIHVMSGPDLMSRWMKTFHPTIRAGDAFLHNSPYHGNSHAGDHCVIAPVVDENGEHHFTVVVKAHVADTGNSQPTTLMATARDVYEEGTLVFPCVKVQENYRDIDDVIRMCKARIRVPDVWYGDLLGMLGSIRIGERELLKLGEEIGWEELHTYTREWFDYSEQRMIRAIRSLPAGRSTVRNAHDPIPAAGIDEGVPIEVTVAIDPEEARIEVDFRNNPDCVPAGINMTEATARTAGMIGIFNSIDHTVPPNGGSYRRISVLLRENCCAGIPTPTASCSTATTGIADRLANGVQRAIAELGDGLGMAEVGSVVPASTAVISGTDPRYGDRPFVDMMILGMTGGAGHARHDGWLTAGQVGDGGLMMRDSTEVDELLHPIRIWADYIVPDSEGAGRLRGAPSNYVEYGPVATTMEAWWATDGHVFPAQGARGGLPGGAANQWKRRLDGTLEELDQWGHVVLQPGETVVSIGTGGGGYGPPMERDPERVRKDVLEGWVSRARAEEIYGVVLDASDEVDIASTSARRSASQGEVRA